MSEHDLPFTGERFIPSCEREIWYEHYHRYVMAISWVKELDVLDAACGEGYGTHLLSKTAKSVTGVDISPQAINHAQKTYQADNLKFVQSNVLNMEFPDDTFDVVVSFETLEHLVEHEELISEFKRVMKPGGILIISTPDKKEYSDKTGFKNEFHLKELYQEEFKELIQRHYKYQQWFGQRLMFNSSIWQLDNEINSARFDCMTRQHEIVKNPVFNPVYFIVVASDDVSVEGSGASLYTFTEEEESVYGHYNAVIRAHIKAEQSFEKLQEKQEKWQKHPIIGRCIKWFGKE